ncbi:Iron-sulfur cluster carrier protein [BD1-7 clade bacterium]|uniref:Iron-sulfur cluster carrier protein n=1 Tax=BD1-7 clade bacterium TaxID=2029982 RepID=A0A5S9QYN9_9GAMM|nr:Iron-sulfur cluster carrier protein [BD1-7 clade bacterium]
MFKVAIVNSKGGVGKSTLTTNIAAWYASQGCKTAILDHDSQGSSSFWASKRPPQVNPVQAIEAFKEPYGMTRSFYLKPEAGTQVLLTDTPAGIDLMRFQTPLKEADAILIPVLPSAIDIHAVAHFLRDLFLIGQLPRSSANIAVVANRVRKNTRIYQTLEVFLNRLEIPFVGTLRDSQNYIQAAASGLGVCELTKSRFALEKPGLLPLLDWLHALDTTSSLLPTPADSFAPRSAESQTSEIQKQPSKTVGNNTTTFDQLCGQNTTL